MQKQTQLVRYTRDRLFRTQRAPAYVNNYNHFRDVEAHAHDFLELAFIVEGRGLHHSSLGVHTLRPGDVVLLRPGAWHSYSNCENINVYNCCFGSELLQNELRWMSENPTLNTLFWGRFTSLNYCGTSILHISDVVMSQCVPLLQGLTQLGVDGFVEGDAEQRIETIGYITLLFARLAQQPSAGAHSATASVSRVHPTVIQAIRLIETDISHDWSLVQLASELNTVPSYLVRLFKLHTGQTPIAYLGQCRAEKAVSLLLSTSLAVARIGEIVGWDDPNYFSRRFRFYFGITPTVYRSRFQITT